MKYLLIGLLALLHLNLSAQQKGASPIVDNQGQRVNSKEQIISNTYAVVVGISDYQDAGIPDLKYADKDAETFANYLRSDAGGKLDQDHLKVLINSQATMAQFAIALDWLWEVAKENDRVIIYFSGHGDVEKKSITQPGFLLCWDAPAQVYMSGGAFALPMLQEVISTLSVQNKAKVIMIMDACRAGKLSGSAINGNQLTNSNLAKQYANEIKILSCQPNEYSLEGTQWGGGRGAFSYHLVNALYGLADNNSDNIISLKEVSRYLEDEVSKEVTPQSQNPMVIGSVTEKLSDVNPGILAALKNGKKNQTQFFSAVESRGIEDEVLASIDSNNVKIYRAFQKALKDKQFLFAENGRDKNDYADYYYNKLITDPQLERLHSTMTRNFAAALQDDAQQILNLSSKSELKEMLVDRDKKARKYLNFAKNLDRAAELLGKSHYMYASLIARKFFFEGWSMSLLHRNADAISGMQALEKFKNSLQWQTDFPQCYYQIAWIYAINLPNADSCEFYANRAAELSPSWVIPYSGLGQLLTEKFNLFDKAKYYFDLALKIDSASAYTWNNLGNYYFYQKQFQHADENYFKAIRYDSTYVDPYYNLACSMSLQNQNEKAYQYLELALKIGYDYNWIHKDADLYELRKDSERWNVLMKKYFPDKIKDK